MSSTHSPPPSPQSRPADLGNLRSRKSAREQRILRSGEDRINRILSSTPNLPGKVDTPHSPPMENEQLPSSEGLAKRKTPRGSRGRASGRRFVPIDQSSVIEETNLKLKLDTSDVKQSRSRPMTPVFDSNVQQQQLNQIHSDSPTPQLPTGLEGLEKLSLLFERMQQQQEGGNSTAPIQLEGLLDNIDRSETTLPFNNLFNPTNIAKGSHPVNITSMGSSSPNQSQPNYIVQFIAGIILVLYLLFVTPAIMDTRSVVESPISQHSNGQPQYLQLAKYLSFSQVQPFYILFTFSIINQTVRMIKYKNDRGSRFQHYPPPLNNILTNMGIILQIASGMWDDLTLVIFLLGHLITIQTVMVSLLN